MGPNWTMKEFFGLGDEDGDGYFQMDIDVIEVRLQGASS
jgi:hypothetical protein